MAALPLPAPTPDIAPAPGLSNLRGELGAVLSAIDTQFDAASSALARSVDAIGAIVGALGEAAGVFEGGVGASAVDDLTRAATALLAVRDHVDQRTTEISTIERATKVLREAAWNVMRCIQVLDVYGMNVKITAAGLPHFMDFADGMRAKLHEGDDQVRGLDAKLALLDAGLRQMRESDQLLLDECRKVLPQVPHMLVQEAEALRAHHAGLARLAQSVSALAQSIQTELFAAIAAIQVGDRVRQRLEHVAAGLILAEGLGSSAAPVHALLAGLADEAGREYARDLDALILALARLQDNAEQLVGLRTRGEAGKAGGSDGGQAFLSRLESGAAEAHGMIAQLDRTDREGLATLDLILRTVDEVSAQAEAITDLRLDVQHMAINIGLSCRTAERVGRPVMVIANEIRTHSNKLDGVIEAILGAKQGLVDPSLRMKAQSTAAQSASGSQLGHFIDLIRECGNRTDAAMETVDTRAGEMHHSLSTASIALDEASGQGPQVMSIAAGLAQAAGTGGQIDQATLQSVFDQIARSYTMAEERELHNRLLPPGLSGIATASPVAVVTDDDDDEDDGLF
jgi:hypothetical protein